MNLLAVATRAISLRRGEVSRQAHQADLETCQQLGEAEHQPGRYQQHPVGPFDVNFRHTEWLPAVVAIFICRRRLATGSVELACPGKYRLLPTAVQMWLGPRVRRRLEGGHQLAIRRPTIPLTRQPSPDASREMAPRRRPSCDGAAAGSASRPDTYTCRAPALRSTVSR